MAGPSALQLPPPPDTIERMGDYIPPGDLEARRAAITGWDLTLPAPEPHPGGPVHRLHGTGLLLSAPHEAAHLRDGHPKHAEAGTGPLAFALARLTSSHALATADPQSGDPNWDHDHPYSQLILDTRPTACWDLHMMRPRGLEIGLGLGPDPDLSHHLREPLIAHCLDAGLRIALNWPYAARGTRTITGKLANAGIPAIQIEISYDCFDPARDEYPALLTALHAALQDTIELIG